jgi:hypothetical protein
MRFGKVKGFILSPIKTFDESKADTLRDATKYCLTILAISAVLFLASAFFLPAIVYETSKYVAFELRGFVPANLFAVCFGFGTTYFLFLFLPLGIFYLFMMGIWLHLWVYVVGGRKNIDETIKVVMYAFTPVLIAWIPVMFIQANIIASVWMVALAVIGVRQVHEISVGRAIIACLIAHLGDLFYTFEAIRLVVG